MAGLYRRGIQRSAGAPVAQVQGSHGAGGAIPRGAGHPQQRDTSAETSQNVQRLGGLLGMMNQQKQAQQEIAPALAAAEQAQANVSNLPNPAFGMQSAPMASSNGQWGGVQMSAFGPGVPMSDGKWGGAANGAVPNFAAGAGLELPGMGTAPAGAMSSFGGGMQNAAANTVGQAANGLQLPQGFNPMGLLDMIPGFGGGAGA